MHYLKVLSPVPASIGSGIPTAALCTIPYRLCPIFPINFFLIHYKGDHHDYRGRTHTGACDRDINFAGFKGFLHYFVAVYLIVLGIVGLNYIAERG